MKLYTVQVAPNPTKVELYIEEKIVLGAQLAIERITVKLMQGEQNEPAHLARSPFGTLPVLELDEGDFITESLPIIEYLEELVGASGPSMWGTAARERAHVRDLERIADTRVLMQLARYIHATKSPLGLAKNTAVANAAAAQIPRGLAFFEGLLSDGREFLAGAQATVADCTLAAAMQFARFANYDFDKSLIHLLGWDERFRARESCQRVLRC